MVASQCFCFITWLVNVSTLKKYYAGYTERFEICKRHLNALLSFERLGRLMDSEIMGTANYKALDLLVICAERNLERSQFRFECDYLQKKFTTCLY
jgi:hypothetical protein